GGPGRGRPRRPADRSHHRAAAAGLQAGRGPAHGAPGPGRRRRCGNHHPEGATVRASLSRAADRNAMQGAAPTPSAAPPARGHAHGGTAGHGHVGLAGLVVGAIGVVFGDIGTSPLYTLREAFNPHYGLTADHDTVLGILSLIFWALTVVVTLKYVTIIMRADNEGEGGIM